MAVLFDRHNAEPCYPEVAGWKGTATSRDAAETTDAAKLRDRATAALFTYGPLTADEIAAKLGVDKLSIRPRLSELRTRGKVSDSHERRYNGSGHRAIVWKLREVGK